MVKIIGLIIGLLFGTTSMAHEQIGFKVNIPDSWKLVTYSADDNLWAYESNDGNHRLTVSVLYYSKEPAHAQQRQFLDDFLKTRQEQSANIATNVNFSEIAVQEHKSAWVAKYNETSPNGRIATTKAISSKIGIANFYLESFSTYESHEEVSNIILSTTGFAS
ncbi:hypothetical protein [Methylomonas sp. HYX-M1]|uniref:hypothetical protein n=1 Tax=Methylomonas sp. HYX-M1 TaxID=3139307 RepID=UPI00345B8177